MPSERTPSGDAYLESIVERTIAPYRDLVTPDVLELMREMIVESLAEDEVGRDLLERARPRKVPIQSGDQPMEDAAEERRGAGGDDD
jgi:hypothetical protein